MAMGIKQMGLTLGGTLVTTATLLAGPAIDRERR